MATRLGQDTSCHIVLNDGYTKSYDFKDSLSHDALTKSLPSISDHTDGRSGRC